MHNYNVGIIGCGTIGKIHIENLQQLPAIKIQAVSDPCIDPHWAKSAGFPQVFSDHQSLLNEHSIDAVLICSPSSLHAEQIIDAANAKKHIFCEKPIAFEPEVIQQCIDATKKNGVKFQLGFNRRFDPNFIQVREVVKSAQIGRPHLLQITSRDPKPPTLDYVTTSGGLFLDMTIHDFDMARFLIGSEVTEVYAAGDALINPSLSPFDIDTAIITLRFENGALGTINNSRKAAYGYDQRVEVFGSEGSISAENRSPTDTRLATKAGITREKPFYFFLERYKDAYQREIKAFIDYLDSDVVSPVSGNDGLQAVRIALAAKKSLLENKPILLKESHDISAIRAV